MYDYEYYFKENMKNEFGSRGEDIANKFIEFLKNKKNLDLREFYERVELQELYKFCEEFLESFSQLKENEQDAPFKIINALKNALIQYKKEKENIYLKHTTQAAISAILSGSPPNINSDLIKKTRDFLRKRARDTKPNTNKPSSASKIDNIRKQ